jgi:hypothetical protein
LRLFRCRSLPLCRSTKHVFTRALTSDNSNASVNNAAVPNTRRVSTFTTRLFSRTLWTVAYTSSWGTRWYGARGRPRRPVRPGRTSSP